MKRQMAENDMAMKGHDEESQPRSGGCNQSTH
jgi:hypothetical protein